MLGGVKAVREGCFSESGHIAASGAGHSTCGLFRWCAVVLLIVPVSSCLCGFPITYVVEWFSRHSDADGRVDQPSVHSGA